MHGDCMTCMGTFGSGARTGMMITTTPQVRSTCRRARKMESIVCVAAARGIISPAAYGLPTGTARHPIARSTPWVFAAPGTSDGRLAALRLCELCAERSAAFVQKGKIAAHSIGTYPFPASPKCTFHQSDRSNITLGERRIRFRLCTAFRFIKTSFSSCESEEYHPFQNKT